MSVFVRLPIDGILAGQDNLEGDLGETEQFHIGHCHVSLDFILITRLLSGEIDEIEERLDGAEKIIR